MTEQHIFSYNREKYPDIYESINADIDRFDATQKEVLDLLIEMLLSVDPNLQKSSEVLTLHHLLAKVRFNLEAAHHLIQWLKEDYRFKTSVNLLYRAILGDMISSIYLMSWFDHTQDEQPYMNAELDIMHKDFLVKITKLIEAEKQYKNYGQDGENYMTEFIDANPTLYDFQNSKWMSASQIRAKTDGKFKIDPGLNTLTETGKIEHIHASNLVHGHQVSVAFTYLSQFQHFTPKMHDFLLNDASGEIEYYEITLSLVLVNCDYL
ncbi:MAG TPA: hypothetical protein DIT07_08395, partial [Sphingobacteriaceae bacterium]|nr:hypothetical protein [Sphingobacteriaceae bacterium]